MTDAEYEDYLAEAADWLWAKGIDPATYTTTPLGPSRGKPDYLKRRALAMQDRRQARAYAEAIGQPRRKMSKWLEAQQKVGSMRPGDTPPAPSKPKVERVHYTLGNRRQAYYTLTED